MESKFKNDADKKYFDIVDLLKKTNADVHSVYAEAVYRKKQEALEKEYGKKVKTCFCRLFRKRCKKDDNICEFRNYGAGSWRDHGQMFYLGQKYTFVSEPYCISNEGLKEITNLSDEYDLEVKIDARVAGWFPSQTVAIIINKRA